MQLSNASHERIHFRLLGLEKHGDFFAAFELALPLIYGSNGAQDIGAGRQPLPDDRQRNGFGLVERRRGDIDEPYV